MPRRRGDGQGHAKARRQAQEATVRALVADAVAEAHEAHAAARRDLTGSARAFLNETALPAVRALNGAEAPTLLPAMHRIVNAITRWSGASPTGRAGPCSWGTPCG